MVESTETTDTAHSVGIKFAMEMDSNMADNSPANDIFFSEMSGPDFSFLEEELVDASVDPFDSMRSIDGMYYPLIISVIHTQCWLPGWCMALEASC